MNQAQELREIANAAVAEKISADERASLQYVAEAIRDTDSKLAIAAKAGWYSLEQSMDRWVGLTETGRKMLAAHYFKRGFLVVWRNRYGEHFAVPHPRSPKPHDTLMLDWSPLRPKSTP